MKKLASILYISLIVVMMACSDYNVVSSDNGDYYYTDEEDCNANPDLVLRPDYAEVIIRVSIEGNNPTSIKVYDGTIERGTLVKDTITTSSRNVIKLLADKSYTYAASYTRGDDVIIVPANANLKYEWQECQGLSFYMIQNNVIDLRLKF